MYAVRELQARPEPRGSPERPRRGGSAVDLHRLSGVLWRGRRLLLAVLGGGVVAGVVIALTLAPRQYVAQAVLAWSPGARTDGHDVVRELRTVADTVGTPINLAEVRKRLAIAVTLESLAKRVEVTVADHSNLLLLDATASDPAESLRLLKTVLDVFLERRVELERQGRLGEMHGLDIALDSAQKQLVAARLEYDAFCKEHGILDLPGEMEQVRAEIAHLTTDQVQARSDAEGQAARIEALNAAANGNAESVVLSERKVKPAGTKLADLESELSGIEDQLAPDHPHVIQLRAQIRQLKRKQDDWSTGVTTERSMGRNPKIDVLEANLIESKALQQAAAGREKALEGLIQEANARAEKLSALAGPGTRQLLALKASEELMKDLQVLRAQAMSGAQSPSTGLSVVEPGELPISPRRSFRKPVAVAVPLLALLAAIGFLLAKALRGLRVHTAVEVAFWGNGPVVFSSRWPAEGNGRDLEVDLVEALESFSGTTLIVLADASIAGPCSRVGELRAAFATLVQRQWRGVSNSTTEVTGERVRVWAGEPSGAALRRAVRHADRVLVVLESGSHSARELASLWERLGAERGLGYMLLSVPKELASLADRAGDAAAFWLAPTKAPEGKDGGKPHLSST